MLQCDTFYPVRKQTQDILLISKKSLIQSESGQNSDKHNMERTS